MFLEYRESHGVRMTYLAGKPEPIWLVAALVRKLGHTGRAARRLGWNRRLVRAALHHAEWNALTMRREEEHARAAGFQAPALEDSPHGLVVPGSQLPSPSPRKFRCHHCRKRTHFSRAP